MKTMEINNKDVLSTAAAVLRAGGVVMHPTETCYGLAVDVFSEEALRNLYLMKGMPVDKPVSILVDSLGMAQDYAIFSDKAMELAHRYWPGPLSIMLPRKKGLPTFFNPQSDFVSIRFSAMDFCTDMVSEFGGPVTTTSANKFSEPELYVAKELEGVDFLVDGGDLSGGEPSTIVKVEGDLVQVVRQGAILL